MKYYEIPVALFGPFLAFCTLSPYGHLRSVWMAEAFAALMSAMIANSGEVKQSLNIFAAGIHYTATE